MRVFSAAILLAVFGAGPLAAQDMRVRTITTMQYAELRPIHYDSASGSYVADPVANAVPLTEDAEISLWGLGVEGLRAYALLRGRGALGSDLVWPRSDDHFDAMVAFLEFERPTYRLRAGRQQRASGLGVYSFDGLTATYRPLPTVRIEGYGGRGLARGFLEPTNSPELTSLDPLIPDQSTILLGTSVWAAPTPGSSFTAIYQRELLADRSGLLSERAAFDGRVTLGHVALSGSADADIAAHEWGKADLSALWRIDRKSFAQVEVFRYRPLLDLTTIWGVFAPEANNGVSVSGNYAPTSQLSFSSSFTYRHYEPVTAAAPFITLQNDAEQLMVGTRWLSGRLTAQGDYELQTGYGGGQSGGDISLSYALPEGWGGGVQATAFQNAGAFRVTDGTAYGLGANARGPIGSRMFLRGEVMRYLHRKMSGQTGVDWNQTRASLSLEITLGASADHIGAIR
ncbi:MAG: hypothetical protein ACHQBP_06610 [Acidimicrobiales bacterium]